MSQESAQSTAATEPVSTTGEAPEPVPTAAAEEPAATAPESATPESSTQEPTQTSPEALLARLTAATTEAEGLRDQLLR
jgi:hypothetical protein